MKAFSSRFDGYSGSASLSFDRKRQDFVHQCKLTLIRRSSGFPFPLRRTFYNKITEFANSEKLSLNYYIPVTPL